jgi:hypothetical protein
MKFAKSILIATIFAVGLFAQSARAQSCQALLDDLIDHASNDTGSYNHVVDFKLTGNRGGSDWVQYATGTLDYTPAALIGGWYFRPARFNGQATQFFSDRLWHKPTPPGSFPDFGHPFNPDATDQLRIGFNIGGFVIGGGSYGDLTYTLLSWGNASTTVTPQCQGNYMYAFLGDQMLTLTFKKTSVAIIH